MRPLCLLLLPGLLLAGCEKGQQDPFERSDTWSLPPAGLAANDANLRAMVINPADLVAGTNEEDTSVAPLATHPVRNLFAGKRARLPSANTTQIGGQGQQQGAGGGSGGTGAGAGANGDQ